MIAIGEIRKVITPYYDLRAQTMLKKSRPALIIAKADAEDYIVLPISRITRQSNRDMIYDIEVNPNTYPKLNLKAISYVRTHKQTVIHQGEIDACIADLKSNYGDLYLRIIETRERFSKEITKQALT